MFDMQGVPLKVYLGGILQGWLVEAIHPTLFCFPERRNWRCPIGFGSSHAHGWLASCVKVPARIDYTLPECFICLTCDWYWPPSIQFWKSGTVVRFLALFSIITGLIVLVGAVINSKYLRMKENAPTNHWRPPSKITKSPWLSTLTCLFCSAYGHTAIRWRGMAVSANSSSRLRLLRTGLNYWFQLFAVMLITMLIGWYNSREVISTPPKCCVKRRMILGTDFYRSPR